MKEEQRRKKKKEKLGLLHMSRAVITIFSRGRGRRENLAEHVTANAAFSLLRGSWIPSLGKNNRRSVDQGGGYAVKNILAVSFWKEDLYIEGAYQVLDLLLLYRPDSCTFSKGVPGVEYGGSLRSRMASHTFQKVRNAGRNDCYVCFWSLFFFRK